MGIFTILLITNCDSDNLGDQVIEASDIGLIHAVMKNLNINKAGYRIVSKPAGIVSKKYVQTKDLSLLKNAREHIKKSDLIIFGGAPMFNYRYQIFYERTATILDLAEEYGKPVIFSAVGIESYDENDDRCQRLKTSLHHSCVRQITTRDGLEELKKYMGTKKIPIGKVADPAVFSASVFRKYHAHGILKTKRKVGIFILRGGGFKDNGYDLSRSDAARLWLGLIHELESRNINYELLTSGHFGDEAFLDSLIRNYNVPRSQCVFNMNTPEKLIEKISSYDVILSTRLHPSIISYSLNVPSVGLIWNNKVKRFYENIGYKERAIEVCDATPAILADHLESAMKQRIHQNKDYMHSVYKSLFHGIQDVLEEKGRLLGSRKNVEAYDYRKAYNSCKPYEGTTKKILNAKLERKFRRIYSKYNELIGQIAAETCVLHYHSGKKGAGVKLREDADIFMDGNAKRLKSGAIEYTMNHLLEITDPGNTPKCPYVYEGHYFIGWQIRFRCGTNWYWYLMDDSFCPVKTYDNKKNRKKKIFPPETALPVLSHSNLRSIVAEACWEKIDTSKEEKEDEE